ncbi:SGNH/GDSL hydrolase family protein [Microbacterium sp. 77mftsu3.1]|uniref:SGNH/GDSL hydrolase family protein n=1 Tax=Microbacterium sp. 77mftsu3.1 TaxID=1761802 RepID=UPI0003A54C3C|nr:SGNH/GDSL hydrolase family protein [Microbacterium sp. 77mftsu3.1]SDG21182.1 GDSL-like Lipase/Acylhydrolase family protein [Microbacterium sp. 77mftsu3.1]
MGHRGKRRRRNANAWWRQQYGGMPVWGIGAALAFLVVAAVAAIPAIVSQPTTSSAVELRPVAPLSTGVASPSSSPVAADGALGEVQALLAGDDPIVISVLGDSTGNGPNEWVARWAKRIGETGSTVTVHYWDDVDETYAEDVTYGSGSRAVEIWNGSMPGKNAMNALEIRDQLQPAEPDLIVYNFGHNIGPEPVDVTYSKIQKAAEEQWGGRILRVAMLQNPAHGTREAPTEGSQRRVSAWASRNGVPLVNIRDAFTANPEWVADYMLDEVHPNDAGSQVWVEQVIKTLGP